MWNGAEIEAMLHMPCVIRSYFGEKQFPLYLKSSYDFFLVETGPIRFLGAQPKEVIPLATLKKHRATLMDIAEMECALILEKVTSYQKKKMVEGNIPFIRPGRELYLPFLGVVLASEREKVHARVERISFITQKLLLTVLYRQIRRATGTKLAGELGVSCMTATRCLDELEAIIPNLIHREGRGRLLVWDGTWRDYWETIRPTLRNPVVKKYYLETPLDTKLSLGGISAICHYSMLSDNSYPTYAVTKTVAVELGLSKLPQVPMEEIPAAVVLVIGYEISLCKEEMVCDPLTAILSLDEDEQTDPRVEKAICEIEGRYINERH